jgi:hypothetical protein
MWHLSKISTGNHKSSKYGGKQSAHNDSGEKNNSSKQWKQANG